MDKIDKKILAMLDYNARIPTATIAKHVRLSRQVVNYRIQQLMQQNIITSFITVVDPTKFYTNVWHVYVKTQHLTEEIEKEILAYLQTKNEIWWIARSEGEWDFIFSVLGNDIFNFDTLIMNFKTTFHRFIGEYQITSLVKVSLFSRGYFFDVPHRKRMYVHKRVPAQIDATDKKILQVIAVHARLPATKISAKVNLGAKQVILRLKLLEKNGVIRAFRTQLNLKTLGYYYYKVCFYTLNFTEKTEHAILSWCEKNPYSLYYVKKIAPWTFEIEFETPEYKVLTHILKELRQEFGYIIRRMEITLIIDEYKGELNIFAV